MRLYLRSIYISDLLVLHLLLLLLLLGTLRASKANLVNALVSMHIQDYSNRHNGQTFRRAYDTTSPCSIPRQPISMRRAAILARRVFVRRI